MLYASYMIVVCRIMADNDHMSPFLLMMSCDVQKIFSPSIYVEELSQSQGFSMEAAMNSVLSGSYGATINISMGPLAGRYAVSEALTAPIQQYVDTQRQYLAGVVRTSCCD